MIIESPAITIDQLHVWAQDDVAADRKAQGCRHAIPAQREPYGFVA